MTGHVTGNEAVDANNKIDDVQGFSAEPQIGSEFTGGKKRRSSKSTKKKGGNKKTKGGKKAKGNKKGTRKHTKGPSDWIKHVKAFCKKTGKTFPEALKDPMCRKSFKH